MESSTPKHIKRHNKTLIPGFPKDLAQLCLYSLPPSLLFYVCHSWRRLLYSPSFPPFFSLYALLSPSHNHQSIEFFSFDPLSSTWRTLPSPPPLHLLHRHPSFLSRKLPIQSITVSNHLVLIAATTHHLVPALSSPLIFHPESNHWFIGPQFSTPRRWCVTGSACGAIYVASGFGSHFRGDVARSMEKWDLLGINNNKYKSSEKNWRWEKKAELKDGRFSREAVEATGYRGKLCMVNVKGNAPKEGMVYDVESNKWEEMAEGMIAGWKGPVTSMDEDEMYVVDEVKGSLSRYDAARDCWEEIIVMPQLKNAEQITAGRGRVCAVCANGERILVVDVVSKPAKVWVVELPQGLQAVALHILPRMSMEE